MLWVAWRVGVRFVVLACFCVFCGGVAFGVVSVFGFCVCGLFFVVGALLWFCVWFCLVFCFGWVVVCLAFWFAVFLPWVLALL